MNNYPYTAQQIAQKLGMTRKQLHIWKREYTRRGVIPEFRDENYSIGLTTSKRYSEKYLNILQNARSKMSVHSKIYKGANVEKTDKEIFTADIYKILEMIDKLDSEGKRKVKKWLAISELVQ
jgi:hypothetical protein